MSPFVSLADGVGKEQHCTFLLDISNLEVLYQPVKVHSLLSRVNAYGLADAVESVVVLRQIPLVFAVCHQCGLQFWLRRWIVVTLNHGSAFLLAVLDPLGSAAVSGCPSIHVANCIVDHVVCVVLFSTLIAIISYLPVLRVDIVFQHSPAVDPSVCFKQTMDLAANKAARVSCESIREDFDPLGFS